MVLYRSTIIKKTMENGSFDRICKTGEHIQTVRILRINSVEGKGLNCSTSQISAEGAEFWVDRRCATVSRVIKTMLEGNFTESRGEVTFADIRTPILEKVRIYKASCNCTAEKKKTIPVLNVKPPTFYLFPPCMMALAGYSVHVLQC